jgi:hypothetical protein
MTAALHTSNWRGLQLQGPVVRIGERPTRWDQVPFAVNIALRRSGFPCLPGLEAGRGQVAVATAMETAERGTRRRTELVVCGESTVAQAPARVLGLLHDSDLVPGLSVTLLCERLPTHDVLIELGLWGMDRHVSIEVIPLSPYTACDQRLGTAGLVPGHPVRARRFTHGLRRRFG